MMGDPSPPDPVAVRAFEWLHSWKSLAWTTREDLEAAKPPAIKAQDLARSIRFEYIETDRGERFGERRMQLAGGGTTRTLGYCDGSVCYRVIFDNNREQPSSVQAHRSFLNEAKLSVVDRPSGFKYLYVGKVPLPEALKGIEPAGPSECLGRPATMFVFRKLPNQKVEQILRYHVDNQTGFPLRVEGFADDAAMADGRAIWRWEATKFEPVQGHGVPLASVHKTFDRKDPRADRPTITRTITTESIQFDRSYPATTFRPRVPVGVPVYLLGGGEPRTEGTPFHTTALATPSPPPATAQTVVAEPIRVAPEAGGWGPWPFAALGLGGVLLAVAVWLRWFRQ